MIHAFSGGVGGAKLARGLADVVSASALKVVVNTADDFDYLGLRIMPDFDSVAYAIAALNDTERGWGRAAESWVCKESLEALGVDTWFALGDKDLGIHLLRNSLLRSGATYTDVAREISTRLGIDCVLLPMSDQPVTTMVVTEIGELSFQDYFVRQRCSPRVKAFRFAGVNRAAPSSAWFDSMNASISEGVVLCPSNPFVSIDPILSLAGVRERLRLNECPVVAVSPIVAGSALKGPLAKMLDELGQPCSPLAIADHYADFLDGIVIDHRDDQYASELRSRGLKVRVSETLMTDREISRQLAMTAIDLLAECGGRRVV